MENQIKFLLFISLFFVIAFSCGDDPIPIPEKPEDDPVMPIDSGTVQVWTTNQAGTILLSESSNLLEFETNLNDGALIEFDPSKTMQVIEGFGAALTGSSAFVLKEHLSEGQRENLLRELFIQEDGIGISFIRLTIGASDFSTGDYTYNDQLGGSLDVDQSDFSLDRDQEHLISVLKEILLIRPNLKIMASPWSPPAWMKTNGSLRNGGQLKEDLYSSYAVYLVKYLEAMADEGIPIEAITIQNEPLLASGYPTMEMSAEQQRVFIRNHLGPALSDAGLSTKVVIYDHNWDNTDFALHVLNDGVAKDYIAGTAFHCYDGDVGAMSTVQAAHPDRGIYFTECSGGDFSPDFGNNLSWNSENLLVGATRNWAKTVLFWNLALDQNAGPTNNGCQDCRGIVTVNSNSGIIQRNVEYYLLGHVAKFIDYGAVRIETASIRDQGLSQVAFLNPDQSRVVVVFNHNNTSTKLRIKEGDESFNHTISAGSLVTLTW